MSVHMHACCTCLGPWCGDEDIVCVLCRACSVLRSALKGAFQEVFINSKAATGTIALTSVTPVNISLNLGGITTLLVDAPAGEPQCSRRGRGGPLGKKAFTLRMHSSVSATTFWGVRISNGRIRRAEPPRGATQRLKSNFQGFAAVRWLAMHACICARVHAPAQRVHACTCDPSAASTCVLHAPPSAATRWCHHCGIIGGPLRGCISLGHNSLPKLLEGSTR